MLDATNYLRAHQKSLPGPLLAFEPEIVISVGKSMLVTSLYLSSSNIDERAKVFYEALPQLYKNEMWAFCDGAHRSIAEGRESLGAMASVYTNGDSMDFFDSPRYLQTPQHAPFDAKCWSLALALHLAILKKSPGFVCSPTVKKWSIFFEAKLHRKQPFKRDSFSSKTSFAVTDTSP